MQIPHYTLPLLFIAPAASFVLSAPASRATVGAAVGASAKPGLRMLGASVGDPFPKAALSALGCANKKSAIFFYGADDAPSCSKQLSAMDAALPDFKALGVQVVGVRNGAGVKPGSDTGDVTLAVDEGDEIRTELREAGENSDGCIVLSCTSRRPRLI